jgi:hypothetical protein
MTSKHWGGAALSCVLLAGACQQPAQFTAADEAAVRGIFDSTVVWFKAKKFESWASNFAEGSYLQPPNAKTVSGRGGLLAWANAFPPLDELAFTNVKIAGEGNMAYGSSDYALKVQGAPPDTGKQLGVFRRAAGGKWEIVGVSFSSDLPVPAAAPAPPAKAPAKK